MLQTLAQKKHVIIQWKIAGVLPVAGGHANSLGFAGVVTGIDHDVLIVAGGNNFPDSMPWLGGKKKYYDDVYVFKKNNKDSLENYRSFKLPFSISYAASCTTQQGILFAGGENENGISNKVLLIQWNPKTQNIINKNLPDLPFVIANASVTANGTMIYFAGGEMINSVSNNFLSLDLNNINAGWKALPSLPKRVSHAVMVVQSDGNHNCIYLIGGRKKIATGISDLYSSVLKFDLKKNQWKEKKSLPYALSAGTGMATAPHCILMFGGDKGETFHQTEELIVAINHENDALKKQKLNQQKIYLQSTHPGFNKEVLLYNTVTDTWTKSNPIHFDSPVTTVAVKWNDDVLIPGGEIKAGVRTPQILFGKISVK